MLPDPVELMEARQENLMEELQRGIPEGFFKCPQCNIIYEGEPLQVSPSPDSPLSCMDCFIG